LTGRVPFIGDSAAALLHQIMNVQHPNPAKYNPRIVKPVVRIIDKALEKDRERRYQEASEMAADLRRLAKRMDAAAARRAGGK
ncbi:hypothetical protein ACFL0Q_05945, partial [Thermodesulfobacteriota bacterium]